MSGKAIVFGNSHLRAIADCVASRGIEGVELVRAEGVLGNRSPPRLRADLAQRVGEARMVVSCLGGNAHSVLGLLGWNPQRRYDFILPGARDIACCHDAELIPFAAIRGTLTMMEQAALRGIEALVSAACCPVRHVLPPPPPEWLEPQRLARVLGLAGMRADPQDPATSLAPPAFRLKLWLAATQVVAAEARRLGAIVVDPPSAACTDDGMLGRAFSEDLTHGNAAYGEWVLRDLGIIA